MNTLEAVVALVGHLAWPVATLLIIRFAHQEIRSLVLAVAQRIRDRSSEVSVTKSGFEIRTAVAAQEARIDLLKAKQDQVSTIALKQITISPQSKTQSTTNPVDPVLQRLAESYRNISVPDLRERIRIKNALADEMAVHVISHNIDPKALATSADEGLLVALASSMLLRYQPGDLCLLLDSAKYAKRLHVRYRVTTTLSTLAETDPEAPRLAERVHLMLNAFTEGADDRLLKHVSSVRALWSQVATQVSSS